MNNIKEYTPKTFGIELPNIGLNDEEKIELFRIREYKRKSSFPNEEKSTVVSFYGRFSGIHNPTDDFEINEEFSKQCCSGWN